MSGQGMTQGCLCHLCWGRSCSLELKSFPALKLLPMTNSNEWSCLWQVSVLWCKTSFAGQFFICSCLMAAQPCSPLALQREIQGIEFPPLFHLQPWPAGTSMDSQSNTFLSSHAAVRKPQNVNFLVEFPAKKWRKDPWRVYTGVLCCSRESS